MKCLVCGCKFNDAFRPVYVHGLGDEEKPGGGYALCEQHVAAVFQLRLKVLMASGMSKDEGIAKLLPFQCPSPTATSAA